MKAVLKLLLSSSIQKFRFAIILNTALLFSSLSLLVNEAHAAFPENFDGVSAPALPTLWTSTRTNTNTPFWVTVNTASDSTPLSAFINNPAATSDASLVSPTFFHTGGQLSFRHKYDLENGWDGGVLEISIDGAAFADIITAGGTFVAGGYIAGLNGGPLIGRQAWTGNSVNFVTTTVNLPAPALNKNVQLRWRRSTDAVVAKVGWWVDSITLPVKTDLAITKTDSVDPIQGGVEFSYSLIATNNGPNIATKVVATDAHPGNMFAKIAESTTTQGTINTSPGNLLTANFGTIVPGGSATATFKMSPSFSFKNPSILTVTSPTSISRDYQVETQFFGADPPTTSFSANLVLLTDSVGPNFNDGCETLTNGFALSNKIALLRSSAICPADEAAARVEGAGALAAVFINSTFSLGFLTGSGITNAIPVTLMTNLDGEGILSTLVGEPVVATFGSLQGQLLNTARITSGATILNLVNAISLQYTSFLNDSDSDGIPDVQDTCPTTEGTNQTDTDSDGLGDICDFCTDTDRDGFGNPEFVINTCAVDGCPTDGAKKVPGVCGCGTSDANSDGDGTPDCKDSCPNDGSKTAAGVCGCGVSDTDANANGITDCLKTPELKAKLNQAKLQLKGIGAILTNNKRKAAKQKKNRKDLIKLLDEIQALISSGPGSVALVNTTETVDSLVKTMRAAMNKAVKAKSSKLSKAKKAANKSLDLFTSKLGA